VPDLGAIEWLGGPSQEIAVLIQGWAYLIAGLMTMDGLLLAIWFMNKDWPDHWPKHWKKHWKK
jgi:hypothetical protein